MERFRERGGGEAFDSASVDGNPSLALVSGEVVRDQAA